MATKKKKTNTKTKKEDKIDEITNVLEKNLKEIDEEIALNKKIEEKKQIIREDLKKQLLDQNKFGRQFDDMVEDYIYMVELKERLQQDINKNGIRYLTTGGNGFTSSKPNESCERLLKVNAQMLKILQDLELKAPEEEPPEEGEGDDLL